MVVVVDRDGERASYHHAIHTVCRTGGVGEVTAHPPSPPIKKEPPIAGISTSRPTKAHLCFFQSEIPLNISRGPSAADWIGTPRSNCRGRRRTRHQLALSALIDRIVIG
jgi:hypothetical protein